MNPIGIGVLGPADIAKRRFLPALKLSKGFKLIGIAVATEQERGKKCGDAILKKKKDKAEELVNNYGGRVFESYESMIKSDEIGAIYIPLPPSLHYIWGKKALEAGKHILLEKPATVDYREAKELMNVACKKRKVVCENYAFLFHKQMQVIREIIDGEKLGNIRLIRTAFGFPHRGSADFRYDASMGGGALLDCGGYTVRLIQNLLGEDIFLKTASMGFLKNYDVDIYGSITLSSPQGVTAQAAFGMDNAYKCDLEIWGSKGYLQTKRIYTPPAELETEIIVDFQGEVEKYKVLPDDQFFHMIEHFYECINNERTRESDSKKILRQMYLVDEIRKFAER